jgi:8-oxo-dGTP pyrophosphatase MutT (NUDIX family)
MNEEIEIWETIGTREIADCRVFRVSEKLKQTGSKEHGFFLIENPDWVNVVAVTKNFDIVLIEQFRHGTDEVTLEIPGGLVDPDEEPEAAAKRELAEETGYTSGRWVLLGRSRPNPALQNNWIYHFAAFDAEKTQAAEFDEHESVSTSLAAITAIPDLIQSGALTHSLVIAAMQYFSFHLMRG